MRRKLLSLVPMRGMLIPGIVLTQIGRLHARNGMIETEGGGYKKTKSPFLLKIKHWYGAYVSRIDMAANSLIRSPQKKLLNRLATKDVLTNRKTVLLEKKILLGDNPVRGNEIRAFIQIQDNLDKTDSELSRTEAQIVELEKSISGINDYKEYCINRMRENAISMCYSYIQGAQQEAKANSYYVSDIDHDEDMFAYLTENATV